MIQCGHSSTHPPWARGSARTHATGASPLAWREAPRWDCASLSKLPVSCSPVLSYPDPIHAVTGRAQATFSLKPARPLHLLDILSSPPLPFPSPAFACLTLSSSYKHSRHPAHRACLSLEASEPRQPSNGPPDKPLSANLGPLDP